MIFHIYLTYEQYWGLAFFLFEGMLFYTAKQIFCYPDEREEQ